MQDTEADRHNTYTINKGHPKGWSFCIDAVLGVAFWIFAFCLDFSTYHHILYVNRPLAQEDGAQRQKFPIAIKTRGKSTQKTLKAYMQNVEKQKQLKKILK